MKILHTSDWHLGQRFQRQYDREEEHTHFINQLSEIVRTEQPDALLVSGDIFDTSTPSISAQSKYVDYMLLLHEVNPAMRIIVTAGNHDSGARLEVDKKLWNAAGVSVVGALQHDTTGGYNLDDYIFPICASSQTTPKGYVIALPHIWPGNYPDLDSNTPKEERQQALYKALQTAVAERNNESLPVVMMAHLYVQGSNISGHDLRMIGGMESSDLATMGDGYDYLALGHIHYPQTLSSDKKARYSGSPIALSFDEDYEHSVTLVEISAHGEKPQLRTFPITPLRAMQTLTVEGFNAALSALQMLDDKCTDYVRVRVKVVDVLPPDSYERAHQMVENKSCRLCRVEAAINENTLNDNIVSIESVDPQKLQPLDIASDYYSRCFNEEMDSNLLQLLQEAINAVNQE